MLLAVVGLLAVIGLTLGTALFVAAEFSLVAADRAELEAAAESGDRRARRALAVAPWLTLGVERTQRLVELGKALSREAVGNGAFPPGVFAAPR